MSTPQKYNVPEDPVEFATRMRAAQERLQKFIVDGMMKHGDPLCFFYASIRKHAKVIGGGKAAVVATERGIKFFYDPFHLECMSDGDIAFMLAHELMHIINRHFVRAEHIMNAYAIERSVFYTRYVPYADLPINESLRGMPDVAFGDCLTYETTSIDKNRYESFEKIVAYLKANPDQNKLPKQIRVIRISETGALTNVDGSTYTGPGSDPGSDQSDISTTSSASGAQVLHESEDEIVILVPESPVDTDAAESEITKTLIRVREKSRDNQSRIGIAINEFITSATKPAQSTWRQLEHRIKKLGTKYRSSEYNPMRFSRKTHLPPGRSKQKGFTMKVIMDESGSMGDLEVHFGLDIIKQAGMSSARDTIHLIRWTTSPNPDIDILRSCHQKWNKTLTRKDSGGTDFSDIFTNVLSASIKADVTIIFTDGYCGYPSAPSGKPEIWIFTTEGGRSQWEQQYGHGMALLISEEEIAALYKDVA